MIRICSDTSMCEFKAHFFIKSSPHLSHLNGFWRVCFLQCVTLNYFPISLCQGFLPSWTDVIFIQVIVFSPMVFPSMGQFCTFLRLKKILCHNICTSWFNFEFLILQTWCLYQTKVVYFVFYSSSMISSMGALQVGHGSPILKVSLHFLQYWEW